MKFGGLLVVFIFSLLNFSIEKSSYYEALASNSLEKLEGMIKRLEKEKSTPLNLAYKGTLIAKKAGFSKSAKEKVNLFKIGVSLLETEIKASPKEIEYRFLRLTIQENCPKILKYNKNIKEDIAIITQGYKKLSNELQQIVAGYAKKSEALNSSMLK